MTDDAVVTNADKTPQCIVCATGQYPKWSIGKKLCETHDICVTCGVKRKELKETPWADRRGAFQCQPCEKAERKARIKTRKAAGFEHDYTDEVVCPHCGYEHGDSWEMCEGERECPECEKSFEMEREVSVSYTTSKIKDKPHE